MGTQAQVKSLENEVCSVVGLAVQPKVNIHDLGWDTETLVLEEIVQIDFSHFTIQIVLGFF